MAVACATTDTGLTTKVKSKLAADQNVNASLITVETRNKVVTLTGNLDSQAEKDKALELARNTEGVVSVVDMIGVRTAQHEGDAPSPDRSLGDKIDDAGITMKVKAKLLDDPLVKGLKIDVDTREGVVYLTGTAGSAAERDKAIALAREAEGVKDVQPNIDLK
jgi:hyperosmotically inducible protein